MRTSSDFFNKSTDNFASMDTVFIPRPSVPFYVDKISSKPTLPSLPKIQYPLVNRPRLKPQITALEQIQQEIQKEVSDLHKSKPTLDQLIQNALKQKIQHDHQGTNQKIVTIKKNTPLTPANPYIVSPVLRPQQFWWPDSKQQDKSQKMVTQQKFTPSSLPKLPTPEPIQVSPSVQIEDSNIKDEPETHKNNSLPQSLLLNSIKDTFSLHLEVKSPPPIVPSSQPKLSTNTNLKILPANNSPSSTNIAVTAFHVSYNLLNYFLFTINPESDPFNDSHRQAMIYSLKAGAYLIILGAIFELMRNIKIGLSLNGELEIISIFLISAILFFFGENLSILLKPINPYQVHEIV